jgi:hypothetical protein
LTIYEDLLGVAWKTLPDSVRRLHEVGGEGTFRIERKGIARLMWFLPPAGEKISIDLRVVRKEEKEIWTRTFDSVHVIKSRQTTSRGEIHERIGPVSVAMTLSPGHDALRYHLIGVRFLGIKIPFNWLPRVVASEMGEGPFVRVIVRVADKFSYSGLVRPR